jgi:hypothetical protein
MKQARHSGNFRTTVSKINIFLGSRDLSSVVRGGYYAAVLKESTYCMANAAAIYVCLNLGRIICGICNAVAFFFLLLEFF